MTAESEPLHTLCPIVSGDALMTLWETAKDNRFALPAVNISNSDTINGVLEAAMVCQSPIVIQISYKSAQFFSGPMAKGSAHEVAVIGAKLAAQHVHGVAQAYPVPVIMHTDHAPQSHLPWIDGLLGVDTEHYEKFGYPLFSSHMIDLSLLPLEQNLEISARYFEKFSQIGVGLEVEVGCTGGKEDGIDNSGLSNERLYTNPEDVFKMFTALRAIHPNFTIAAAFGNIHGVYAAGQVRLRPRLLADIQSFIGQRFEGSEKPVSLVFHGSSGSSDAQLKEAVGYGVVKVNIDTDMQWALWSGIKDYYQSHSPYLQTQLGNPEGEKEPNKGYYDPRAWMRAGQVAIGQKLSQIMNMLNSAGKAEIFDVK